MAKDCINCEWDEMCGWKFRDGRGHCDKWEPENGGTNEREQREAGGE